MSHQDNQTRDEGAQYLLKQCNAAEFTAFKEIAKTIAQEYKEIINPELTVHNAAEQLFKVMGSADPDRFKQEMPKAIARVIKGLHIRDCDSFGQGDENFFIG